MADDQGPLGGATAGVAQAGETMRQTGKAMADSGSQLGLKMLDQAETNTREAFNAMRDAAQAKDAAEVMKIQGDYLRDQGGRAMGQAREIGEMIMQFGRNAIAPMQGGGGAGGKSGGETGSGQ